jgi:hypothetical protein
MVLTCRLCHPHHSLLLQASVSSIKSVMLQFSPLCVTHKVSHLKELAVFVWTYLLLDINEVLDRLWLFSN